MAKTIRAKKGKGRRLQNEVREMLLEYFKELQPDDVKCAVGSETGKDIHLSPYAQTIFPYSVECKNQEKLSIWAALKQAENNSTIECPPMLIFKRNHSEIYATLKFTDLLKLMESKTIDN